MPRASLFAMVGVSSVLLMLGGEVGSSAASPGVLVPAFRIAIPPPATLQVVDYQYVAKPGVRLPVRIRFQVANRAQLAKTIVAAIAVVPSPKTRRLDVVMIVLRRRAARTTSSVSAEPAPDFIDVLTDSLYLGWHFDSSWSLPMRQFVNDFELQRDWKKMLSAKNKREIGALHAALENPEAAAEPLVGIEAANPFMKEIGNLIATLDQSQVSRPTLDEQAQLDQIVAELEQTIKDDLNGDGAIGPPVKPTGPTLYRYSIPAFDVSFTGPAANGSPAVTDHYSKGTGCGDPARGGWAISTTTTGIAVAPTDNIANFSRQNPFRLFAHSFNLNGTATGAINILLHYLPGPPATITVQTSTSGDITRVSAPTSPLPITLTTVTSC
jgi:hypothetical protein